MKKLILLFTMAILLAGLTGCPPDSIEYVYLIDYAYVNESSSEITVHSVKPSENTGRTLDSLFVIPVNGQHHLSFGGFGYKEPFRWTDYLFTKQEYVTISNGEKIVTQTVADNGELFDMNSYTLISEENRRKKVEFVFTDEFFENGEPIEK